MTLLIGSGRWRQPEPETLPDLFTRIKSQHVFLDGGPLGEDLDEVALINFGKKDGCSVQTGFASRDDCGGEFDLRISNLIQEANHPNRTPQHPRVRGDVKALWFSYL